MNDPMKALKNAYDSALGNISVGSLQIPFYKVVNDSANEDYMYIQDFTMVESSAKDDYQTECTITIAIASNYNNAYGDIDSGDDIANKILQTINVKAGNYLDLTGDGFYVITTSLDNSTSAVRQEKDGTSLVRTLRFRHIIGES